ncbi:hypothetical protein DTO212C5_5420 [Paecilomyces variotii]|nr:hypothetical protein DTO212C5_5420 [Paecilomyces variotii]
MDPQNCPIRTAVPSLGFLAATGPRRIYSRLAGSGLGLAADDDRIDSLFLSVILTPVEEYVDGRRLLI